MIEVQPDGGLVLRALPPIFIDALLSVPGILDEPGADIKERLFPVTYGEDAGSEAEWHRFGRPELEALLASRAQIVLRDLAGLGPDPELSGAKLEIAADHRNAWISGLNAARLALGIRYGIEAADMERQIDLENLDDKEIALLRIHMLAEIQAMLIETGEL